MKKYGFIALLLVCTACVAAQDRSPVEVTVLPRQPFIERRDCLQLLNFDLAVKNAGKDRLRLSEIELSVYDSNNHLAVRKTVNSDGLKPGIEVVAPPMLTPGETIDIFNPFFWFDSDVPLNRLDYAIRYLRENSAADAEQNQHRLPIDYDVEAKVSVRPQAYVDKTDLFLPLQGRLLVWEGHDFYAHHRRIPVNAPQVRSIGLKKNSNRYGMDLILIDNDGRAWRNTPYKKENWLSYGTPIYAPGAGKVVAMANDVPENYYENKRLVHPKISDPTQALIGNYVVIDHGDGEYSFLVHMMPGSVLVKPGDAVQEGQMVGKIGFAGDAIFPHLHYSLVGGPNIYDTEALPVYFHQFNRLLGATVVAEKIGQIDSGDIVESALPYLAKP